MFSQAPFRQVWCFQNLQICLLGLQKYSDDALDVLEFIFKNFLAHSGTSSLWVLFQVFSEATHRTSVAQVVARRHTVPGGAVITGMTAVSLVFHKVGSVEKTDDFIIW